MQTLLEKLYHGTPLALEESERLFQQVAQGQLSDAQLAAALIALKVRGETVNEIGGAVRAFQAVARPFPRPDYPFADIVGTGGDGCNSINISTASAFVAAACGLKIAKHGNRSVSSRAGSSDLLSAFGIRLDSSAETSRALLDEENLCFLFAPHYHPAFRHASAVRQLLKTRTVFNVLGPLLNPARPPLALIGVYSAQLIAPIAETLRLLGYQRAAVVHGAGMDEVAVHGPTQVAELYNGAISHYTLTPEDFGLKSYPLSALTGGDATENRVMLRQLLQGQGDAAHEAAVVANVALLLRLFGQPDLRRNAQQVRAVIRSGAPWTRVVALVEKGELCQKPS